MDSQPETTKVVRTIRGGVYPCTPNVFFECQVLKVRGEEVGGRAFDPGPTNEYLCAANLGNRVPPLGTKLIVSRAGDRWVFTF